MIYLYSTDPTQETCATVDNNADYAGAIRQHELDHTDHTRWGVDDMSALKPTVDHFIKVWHSKTQPVSGRSKG